MFFRLRSCYVSNFNARHVVITNSGLRGTSFRGSACNKLKLKPNGTELCVCVQYVSGALGRTAAYSSCLSHMWNDSHSQGWIFFFFKIPLQSSHIHITTTLKGNQPTMEEGRCVQQYSETVHFPSAFRPVMVTNKSPWFSSYNTLKIPLEKKTHLPVFFFFLPQCLYSAELCLGYTNAWTSLFFPRVVIYKHGQGCHTPQYSGSTRNAGRSASNYLIMFLGSFLYVKIKNAECIKTDVSSHSGVCPWGLVFVKDLLSWWRCLSNGMHVPVHKKWR